MTKAELVRLVREWRDRWDSVVDEFDEAGMCERALPDGRTAKDVVAHVTWYEREVVGTLRARALDGSELWELRQRERNAAIFEQNCGRALDDVMSDSTRVFSELIALLEGLEEDDLHDPERFPGMPPEWEPWELVAENTYKHYEGHLSELRQLLGGNA